MGGTVVKGGGVVEAVLSIADRSLSGELNFAVYRGCARGIVGKCGRGTVLGCCG